MNRLFFTLIILLISVSTFQCQKSPGKKSLKKLPPKVLETIERRIAKGATHSIAIALIDSAGVTYYNFGKTQEGGKDVDEHTIYEIGSISKVFTGILLAQQVLDGDLKLEDEINKFLPDSVKAHVKGEAEITFGNLTDHTSGFPGMPDNFTPANPNNPYADYTVDQMYDFVSKYQPDRKVGAAFEYSNFAQGLLGNLLAQNKNQSYEELMVKTIADPLGMKNTRIGFTGEMKENLALGHSEGKVVESWDILTLAGAGGIRSSTSDMAKFIAANLGYLDSPLADAMAMSHTVRHSKAGNMRVGMGWFIKKGKEGDVIWHNGGTGGYRTFTGFVKETGIGVVLLTNSSISTDDIGFHLLDPGSKIAHLRYKSEAVDVPESTLEEYVGVYSLGPELTISITKEGKQLFGQATGQGKFEIHPQNDSVFFLTVVEATITFQRRKGAVESLILFQGGQKMLGKRIE
ncbi:serine hydrolase [Pleomorphovibrio marinus]|uniref:serine hydrolase n=1 Tax=Pleomorphovibrio marinus TaxID=2164132 RepID=UPI000E0B8C6D|nr:serine hydrolase [Pleomorphovibrio marinus]